MKDLVVTPEDDEVGFDFTDKKVGEMQTGVTVSGNSVSGTLKYIEGGLSPAGPLAGDGHFLALHWSDPETGVTSLKVGLDPSASGMEPVECIDDTDRNGVFKIANTEQVLKLIQSDGEHTKTQVISLGGLTLEEVPTI